ncbi:acyl-CoA N-acyltransferase [Entophlyctis helioformis]|nr:acyl-CoA N-acyltransferase [Entophlyctis helioformis]
MPVFKAGSETHTDADADQGDGHDAEFHPLYSYPVFGDEEQVFGFKNLKIKLHYTSGSLYAYLGFTYSSRIGEGPSKRIAPGVQPQDVVGMISEKLAMTGVTNNYDEFLGRVKADEQTFTPMGQKVHEYSVDDEIYELYECTFETPKFKDYHRRLQTFLLWFIEGASFLHEDDLYWRFLLLFKKETGASGKQVYRIVGYMSYYPFFHFPDQKRMRISQFIILPPYQKQGHGRSLYTSAYKRFVADKDVIDITVEDPNDGFQDLRDRCDVEHLISEKALAGLTAPLTRSQISAMQKQFKLCRRQADRCAEILMLDRAKRMDARAMRQYRLFVKARIYRQNREVLEGMEFDERLDKLHSTYLGLVEDYQDVLDALD